MIIVYNGLHDHDDDNKNLSIDEKIIKIMKLMDHQNHLFDLHLRQNIFVLDHKIVLTLWVQLCHLHI